MIKLLVVEFRSFPITLCCPLLRLSLCRMLYLMATFALDADLFGVRLYAVNVRVRPRLSVSLFAAIGLRWHSRLLQTQAIDRMGRSSRFLHILFLALRIQHIGIKPVGQLPLVLALTIRHKLIE